MWTPFSLSLTQNRDTQVVFADSYFYPSFKIPCDEYKLSNSGSPVDEGYIESLSFCTHEEDETAVSDYLNDDIDFDRRSSLDYGNQFYMPGYSTSELVAASTASLPVFAPVDPTARTNSNPIASMDEPPYAIYIIPIVLFSVILITIVVLSIRYRRIKRPQRMAFEPPPMNLHDPEKMGTLRSTPLGIFMPDDDPFTRYKFSSDGASPPGEPSRPVPVFMPSESGSSHNRRSTIRQSRSYTYTMPAVKRPKRRPKVSKAQSASSIGASHFSAERVRPPIPAARMSSRSASRRLTGRSVASIPEPIQTPMKEAEPTLLGGQALEFGEDIPLNTPQQPDGSQEEAKKPKSPAPKPPHEFWEKP